MGCRKQTSTNNKVVFFYSSMYHFFAAYTYKFRSCFLTPDAHEVFNRISVISSLWTSHCSLCVSLLCRCHEFQKKLQFYSSMSGILYISYGFWKVNRKCLCHGLEAWLFFTATVKAILFFHKNVFWYGGDGDIAFCFVLHSSRVQTCNKKLELLWLKRTHSINKKSDETQQRIVKANIFNLLFADAYFATQLIEIRLYYMYVMAETKEQ